MNHGKFFSLDLEASHIEKGIVVFDYTDIFDASVDDSELQTTPRYPIFVSISSASVKFILQYCVYKQKDGNFKILPKGDKLTNGGKLKTSSEVRHLEEVLIELPLTTTNGYSLAATLKRLYLTPFPIQLKNEQNYILQLIERRYENANMNNLPYSYQKYYESKKKADKFSSNITYSSLPVYKLLEGNGYKLFTIYKTKDKKTQQEKTEKKYDKVLQKIVLDFFFDMMHSDVFKNSMHYDEMYQRFMSDFFCSAIIHKSEYYYQRALVNNLFLENQTISESATISIYAENLDRAEKHWLRCIQSPEADRHFEFQPNWFEIEADKGSSNSKNEPPKDTWPYYKIRHTNYWFAAPEDELQRVYYRTNNDDIACSKHLLSKYDEIKKTDDKNKQSTSSDENKYISRNKDHIQQRTSTSAKWLLKRYAFSDAYRVSAFPGASLVVFASLAAIIGLIAFACWKAILIPIVILAIVIIIIGVQNKDFIVFLFPRLIASIAAAWLTIALSEDLYKTFFDAKLSWWTVGFIIVLISLFVYYEVYRTVPKVFWLKKLLRALGLMVISFAISLLVGMCVINFTGEKMLARCGILPDFYRDRVLVKTATNAADEQALLLNFDAIDESQKWNDSLVINAYTHSSYTNMNDAQSRLAVHEFANTPYGDDYMSRIAYINSIIDDSLKVYDSTLVVSDSVRGRFLLRHENTELLKDLLPYVEHSDGRAVAQFVPLTKDYTLFLLHDFLIQFAVIAMFIGIFIQMIFEEKNVTESI